MGWYHYRMNPTHRTRLWVSAAIIAAIVLIAFALSVPHTQDLKVEMKAIEAPSTPVVTLHDAFKKGAHTISGSIEVPNACTAITTSSALVGEASSTERILVSIGFEVDLGTCLQVPTEMLFKEIITAPAGLPVEATVNGVLASTTSS
jgi:hypothetical protein